MSSIQLDDERDGEALRRAQRAHEPSMDEILASIRAIIADDKAVAAAKVPSPVRSAPAPSSQVIYSTFGSKASDAPAPAVVGSKADDNAMDAEPEEPGVYEQPVETQLPATEPLLTLEQAQPELQQAQPELQQAQPELQQAQPELQQAPPLPQQSPPAIPELQTGHLEAAADPQETETATQEEPLLSSAADRIVAASFQTLMASLAIPDARRVEEMSRELLRPMLKAWLDENLPSLVERLVRAEIQRVARGGR